MSRQLLTLMSASQDFLNFILSTVPKSLASVHLLVRSEVTISGTQAVWPRMPGLASLAYFPFAADAFETSSFLSTCLTRNLKCLEPHTKVVYPTTFTKLTMSPGPPPSHV